MASDAARAQRDADIKSAFYAWKAGDTPGAEIAVFLGRVAFIVDAHVAEQTVALRAALQRIIDISYMDEPPGERVEAMRDNARAFLADAGQAGEEWRALNDCYEILRTGHMHKTRTDGCYVCPALAAVERERRR